MGRETTIQWRDRTDAIATVTRDNRIARIQLLPQIGWGWRRTTWKPFEALQEAGNRASRDLKTLAGVEGIFLGSLAVVYRGPAAWAAVTAVGSEVGVLSLGKGFQLARNASGKIKGNIEDIRAAVFRMSPEQLKQAADELRQSIQVRSQELLRLGDEPAHRLRVARERDLLRTIEKKLGGN